MTNVMHEQLDRVDSLDTLALANLGQLIVTRGALPAAVPVRYLVEQDRVLIHIFAGPDPVPWRDGEVVTLHASVFDRDQCRGWSVSVTGRVHGTPNVAEVQERPIAPWIPEGGGDLLEVIAEVVRGERLGPVQGGDNDGEDRTTSPRPAAGAVP